MKFLSHCQTLAELKKEFHRLAMVIHPDKGGSTRDMQDLLYEYNKLKKILPDTDSAYRTYTEKEANNNQSTENAGKKEKKGRPRYNTMAQSNLFGYFHMKKPWRACYD